MSRYQSHHLVNRFEIATKFNHLFVGSLPTFPENVMQIRSEDCAKVPNRQTDKQRWKHNPIGGGKNSGNKLG